jgi:glycosyltransferase involved in cell wall biosynthesis
VGALILYVVLRLRFITSTPWNIQRGSGTFVGIDALARAVRDSGVAVEVTTPRLHLPVYTLERIAFNEALGFSRKRGFDATVGFDLDGYRIAGREGHPHVAALKGVIADEFRQEAGMTRATMALQGRFEAIHVHRADLVLATSRHSAEAARRAYHLPQRPRIVPELIDLAAWRALLCSQRVEPDAADFTVLSVCRFYPRKRLHKLLEATAQLRGRIPRLALRLVGNGPEAARLHALCRELRLEGTVHFAGDVSREQLAAEYSRCDVFCLPSVQEGFGIVFLEAMGADKPIVAARAAAIPEVVPHGVLIEPDDVEALAGAIESLYQSPRLRAELAAAGNEWVQQFDAPRVASLFLGEVRSIL